MYTETEGIVLKQTKIAAGRRMLVIFSKHYGKISAGTYISERGNNKSALALRPFAYGKYQIRRTGDYYHINGCETISSHYSIGEDIDKFLCASCGMEFTNKLLPEEAEAKKLFVLFSEFLDMMEKRTKKHETLLVGYQLKALALSGSAPLLDSCVMCGSKENLTGFSITDGGTLCEACKALKGNKERLIYETDFDILNVIKFLIQKPLSQLENLALGDSTLEKIKMILKDYAVCHLDIGGLKSEECMNRR